MFFQRSQRVKIIIVKIYENEREFDLSRSSSGYFEVLHILSQIGTTEDDVLIIDEPTPHLRPLKIKYLGITLSDLELSKRNRQLIIITHSPFFVDTALFSKGRNLVYIRKHKNGSSNVISKPRLAVFRWYRIPRTARTRNLHK
jgi:predicted ATPase